MDTTRLTAQQRGLRMLAEVLWRSFVARELGPLEDDKMLTPAQAEARFGKLTSDGVPLTYLEFADNQGVWKPQYDTSLNLVGYKLLADPIGATNSSPENPST